MVTDDILASVASSTQEDLLPIMERLVARHTSEWVERTLRRVARGASSRGNTLRKGMIRASEMPPAVPAKRLWFGLYPGTVVLWNGESDSGKSSALYNIVCCGSMNQDLWDIPFGLGRPLNILYFDPENSGNWEEGIGGQSAVKLERIMGEDWVRPPNLLLHHGRNVNFADPAQMEELEEIVREEKIDLLLLDPLVNLYNTKDENDNAEAALQMKALLALARGTGVCVVVCHHVSPKTDSAAGGNYGRGASARLASADVCIVWRARRDREDVDDDYTGQRAERDDVCRLMIAKNRIEGRNSLFLQMAGLDQFRRVGYDEWKEAEKKGSRGTSVSRVEYARQEMMDYLAEGRWTTRQQVQDTLRSQGIGRNSIDEAIDQLEGEGLLLSRRRSTGSGQVLEVRRADLPDPDLGTLPAVDTTRTPSVPRVDDPFAELDLD